MEEAALRRAFLALAIAYALLETAYALRLPLVMDEFDGAYEAYLLRFKLPYRDFVPYKTVLGYYGETAAALWPGGVWPRIMAIKLELVLINALMLAAAAFFLGRRLDPRAVAFALLLLIACGNFLERSAELRVDMLTAWAGLWSLLFLLERRVALAGALCGVAFLVSQKGALYFIAANAALCVVCLWRERSRERLKELVAFDAAFAAVVVAYAAVWSFVSSPAVVLRATFTAAAGQALNTAYAIRWHFWSQFLLRNPLSIALAAIAVAALLRKRTLVAIYGLALLIQCALYTQPWPYFFVLLLPTLFVLHAHFFDERRTLPRGAVAAIAVAGIVYPALRIPVALGRDNAYQRYNVRLASAMLGPSDTYLAGNDIIHDHEQTLAALARLGSQELEALRNRSETYLGILVGRLDAVPPKLVIGNYRIYNLPPPLLRYIGMHYRRLSGSILAYAPLLNPGRTTIALRFGGRYRVDAMGDGTASIDGAPHRSGDDVHLSAGLHAVAAQTPLCLRLLPGGIESLLDPQFIDERDFYPNVYDY